MKLDEALKMLTPFFSEGPAAISPEEQRAYDVYRQDSANKRVMALEVLRKCLEIDDDAMLELDEDKHPPSYLRVEIEDAIAALEEVEGI